MATVPTRNTVPEADIITPAIVRDRVDAIHLVADDDERAHAMEDQLHTDVVRAIAANRAHSPALCAKEALRTLDIDFRRWCA